MPTIHLDNGAVVVFGGADSQEGPGVAIGLREYGTGKEHTWRLPRRVAAWLHDQLGEYLARPTTSYARFDAAARPTGEPEPRVAAPAAGEERNDG